MDRYWFFFSGNHLIERLVFTTHFIPPFLPKIAPFSNQRNDFCTPHINENALEVGLTWKICAVNVWSVTFGSFLVEILRNRSVSHLSALNAHFYIYLCVSDRNKRCISSSHITLSAVIIINSYTRYNCIFFGGATADERKLMDNNTVTP